MMKLAHDLWSKSVDYASFGMINLLQIRGKAGSHTREEFEVYADRWRGASLEEYYAIPECPPWKLPASGACTFPTGLSCDKDENNHVHLQIWPGPKGFSSPAMILLHGFMSVSDVGYRIWARHLNSLGWTAVFFDLPYHYRRKPKGTMSGEMALSSNFIRTAETIRQGVIDLRLVIQTLKAHGTPQVGCWATSYGGWMASLLCVVEGRLSTAWLVEAITDVDHAIWESPASITLRSQVHRRGITRGLVAQHLPLVCPSFHQPVIPAEHILLMAGTFDPISPVASIRSLNEKWKGSHYAEIRQGHVGYQLMPASWRLAQEKMPHFFS